MTHADLVTICDAIEYCVFFIILGWVIIKC